MLMAFQVLNLSIDSIDFRPIAGNTAAVFNEMNSFSEYVSEVVLGHTNQYPESGAHTAHHTKHHWQKHMGHKPFIPMNMATMHPPQPSLPELNIPASVNDYDEYSHVINPPPPKISC